MHEIQMIRIRQTPFVLKNGFQRAELQLRNKGGGFDCWCRVHMDGFAAYTLPPVRIAHGKQKVELLLKDTNQTVKPGETTSLTLELFDHAQCGGKPLAVFYTDRLERTRHWTFYYSQTMHTDLGYTDYQEDLRPLFSSFLDTVKQYMKNSDERSTDLEKYRYAIESGWVMGEGYMARRNADEIQEILDLIDQKRMVIGAGRFNYTTECFSTEESARAAYYTNRLLVDRLGIAPATMQRMFDNPALSKGYVDAASCAGIRYAMHSLNPDRSPYHIKKQYDLFYLEGMHPDNKLLVFNGKTYGDNYGFGGTHNNPEHGTAALAQKNLLHLIEELEGREGRTAYPYDKFPLPLIPYGDNKQPMELPLILVNEVNKLWEDAGYLYPHIRSAFPETFFEEVEREFGPLIPVETGTEENWWNDGWGTTAFESGVNKRAGALVPAAETAASLASLCYGAPYPYEDLYNAVERNLTYDEHTWGYHSYSGDEMYHRQFEWKRSNAFAAKALAEKSMHAAVKTMASRVGTDGAAIFVYNPLNQVRNDLVRTGLPADFSACFEILDNGKSIPYSLQENQLAFVAENVPAVGYKVFQLRQVRDKPVFDAGAAYGENYIENAFYKISFAPDGTLSSIRDKKNNNRELVDIHAKEKFNQYRYYNDFGIPFRNMGVKFSKFKWKLHTPKAKQSICKVTSTPIGVTMELNTATFRTGSIRQRVTLYRQLDRIDISNEVIKAPLARLTAKEEAFYTFPFRADGAYQIRYDLPVGNTEEGAQVFGTSTDWYTANKWVNVYDRAEDYSMTVALPDSALMQFGERRTGTWSFDYKSKKPYLYSYIMNNMWQTNFQGDQPGYVKFNYAVFSNKGEDVLKINQAAWGVCVPLRAEWIPGRQSGEQDVPEASLVKIDRENVHISTMKAAQANGDGLILRFAEVGGEKTQQVTVTLPDNVTAFTQTDLIENDIGEEQAGNCMTFSIEPYGFQTFRIKTAHQLAAIQHVQAYFAGDRSQADFSQMNHVQRPEGTWIEWDAVDGALYYEVFRVSKKLPQEKPRFLAATHLTAFFDSQVTGALSEQYSYCVRACATGVKGTLSDPAEPSEGGIKASYPMEAPVAAAVPREKTRIDLYWTPVTDVEQVCFYEIWRDGVKIAETENAYVTTYRDRSVRFGKQYEYIIKAVNSRSQTVQGDPVTVCHTDEFFNRP